MMSLASGVQSLLKGTENLTSMMFLYVILPSIRRVWNGGTPAQQNQKGHV